METLIKEIQTFLVKEHEPDLINSLNIGSKIRARMWKLWMSSPVIMIVFISSSDHNEGGGGTQNKKLRL